MKRCEGSLREAGSVGTGCLGVLVEEVGWDEEDSEKGFLGA